MSVAKDNIRSYNQSRLLFISRWNVLNWTFYCFISHTHLIYTFSWMWCRIEWRSRAFYKFIILCLYYMLFVIPTVWSSRGVNLTPREDLMFVWNNKHGNRKFTSHLWLTIIYLAICLRAALYKNDWHFKQLNRILWFLRSSSLCQPSTTWWVIQCVGWNWI